MAKYPSEAGQESALLFASKAGFVLTSRSQRLLILLAASWKCFYLDKELARTIFPYFAEVAKTALLRCSSGMADNDKLSTVLWLLGPLRHNGIGMAVNEPICIPLFPWTLAYLFVYLLVYFKITREK